MFCTVVSHNSLLINRCDSREILLPPHINKDGEGNSLLTYFETSEVILVAKQLFIVFLGKVFSSLCLQHKSVVTRALDGSRLASMERKCLVLCR